MELLDASKENIQPLRRGRNVSTLSTALQAQTDADIYHQLMKEREEFEILVRSYSGDDPLQPWYDYVQWVEQNFPKNGREGNLKVLLENSLSQFKDSELYSQDVRYIDLWTRYMSFADDPLEMYKQVHARGIGSSCAIFYQCWAEEYEHAGDLKRADQIYIEGIRRQAQPIEELESAHTAFQIKVARNILGQNPIESREKYDDERTALSTLRAYGRRRNMVDSTRVGNSIKHATPGVLRPHSNVPLTDKRNGNAQQSKVTVYNDENAESSDAVANSQVKTAISLSQQCTNKENLQKPGRWNEGKLKKKSSTSSFGLTSASTTARNPTFDVHVDENSDVLRTPKTDIAASNVLKARRQIYEDEKNIPIAIFEPPDPTKIAMYPKKKVYCGGTEFSLEELRAIIYIKREQDRKKSSLESNKIVIHEVQNVTQPTELKFSEQREIFEPHDLQRQVLGGSESRLLNVYEHDVHITSKRIEAHQEPGKKNSFDVFVEAEEDMDAKIKKNTPLDVELHKEKKSALPSTQFQGELPVPGFLKVPKLIKELKETVAHTTDEILQRTPLLFEQRDGDQSLTVNTKAVLNDVNGMWGSSPAAESKHPRETFLSRPSINYSSNPSTSGPTAAHQIFTPFKIFDDTYAVETVQVNNVNVCGQRSGGDKLHPIKIESDEMVGESSAQRERNIGGFHPRSDTLGNQPQAVHIQRKSDEMVGESSAQRERNNGGFHPRSDTLGNQPQAVHIQRKSDEMVGGSSAQRERNIGGFHPRSDTPGNQPQAVHIQRHSVFRDRVSVGLTFSVYTENEQKLHSDEREEKEKRDIVQEQNERDNSKAFPSSTNIAEYQTTQSFTPRGRVMDAEDSVDVYAHQLKVSHSENNEISASNTGIPFIPSPGMTNAQLVALQGTDEKENVCTEKNEQKSCHKSSKGILMPSNDVYFLPLERQHTIREMEQGNVLSDETCCTEAFAIPLVSSTPMVHPLLKGANQEQKHFEEGEENTVAFMNWHAREPRAANENAPVWSKKTSLKVASANHESTDNPSELPCSVQVTSVPCSYLSTILEVSDQKKSSTLGTTDGSYNSKVNGINSNQKYGNNTKYISPMYHQHPLLEEELVELQGELDIFQNAHENKKALLHSSLPLMLFSDNFRDDCLSKSGFPSEVHQSHCIRINEPLDFGNSSRLTLGDKHYCILDIVSKKNDQCMIAIETSSRQHVQIEIRIIACLWAQYVREEIRLRMADPLMISHFVNTEKTYIFTDVHVVVSRKHETESIQSILEGGWSKAGNFIVESDILHIASQMINLVYHLHQCNIVHANLSLDSFGALSRDALILFLNDFQHAVDVTLLPPHTLFDATEKPVYNMLNACRVSPFKVDYIGLADVFHQLIFNEPLKVNEECGTWNISALFPRNFEGNLWKNVFKELLNNDEVNLQYLCNLIRRYIRMNSGARSQSQ